jgi:hypothetical protein
MSTKYMDWADLAGDHHAEVEADLRKNHEPRIGGNCEHEEIDNQGVCLDCEIAVEGWEPNQTQLDQHYGTSVAA